jgi:hypothetical protein
MSSRGQASACAWRAEGPTAGRTPSRPAHTGGAQPTGTLRVCCSTMGYSTGTLRMLYGNGTGARAPCTVDTVVDRDQTRSLQRHLATAAMARHRRHPATGMDGGGVPLRPPRRRWSQRYAKPAARNAVVRHRCAPGACGRAKACGRVVGLWQPVRGGACSRPCTGAQCEQRCTATHTAAGGTARVPPEHC